MIDVEETIARALHDAYLSQRLAEGDEPGATPSLTDWENLPDEFRESSRRSARDVSLVVATLGYEVVPASGTDTRGQFSEEEIEILAERLHDRWVEERKSSGWQLGSSRDDLERIHPDLVAWQDLPEERREIDRHLVRELPWVLESAGLTLSRRA